MIQWCIRIFVMLAHSGQMLKAQPERVAKIFPCKSKIYCQGPILETVNRLRLYPDSKTFVDMPLKISEEKTLENFIARYPNASAVGEKNMTSFISEHFSPAGNELFPHDPVDWTNDPYMLNGIKDTAYRLWASELNLRWKKLCKKMNQSAASSPYTSSIILLPNEFVVPGGRFREVYYWDAYWIILGLLHSNMTLTTRAMLDNYLYLIDRYGFVPNGGRVYYLERSQPPFLIPMVKAYYDFTNDDLFLRKSLPTAEKEMEDFWKQKRSMQLNFKNETHTVYHYNTPTNTPRPESFREDVEVAQNLPEEDQANLYSNIASAAESGWDFSSRWLADSVTFRMQKTRLVLPVDLNAILCGNYRNLADLHRTIGNTDKAEKFERLYHQQTKTMMKLFYNDTIGVWFDYHLDNQRHNFAFYPSNLSPLFTGCYDFTDKANAIDKIVQYFKDSNMLDSNGIPTSSIHTGQQWDWPNAWPPLVHMLVIGLHNTGEKRLQAIAQQIMEHWTRLNYDIYKKTKHMYEKYDVVARNKASGGEYDVQEGFGWTNGVIIDFLVKYGSGLNSTNILKQIDIDIAL